MTKRTWTSLIAAFMMGPGLALAATAVEETPIAAKLVVGQGQPEQSAALEGAATDVTAGPVGAEATTPAAPAKVDTAKLPENEIPVLTGAKDTKKAGGGGLSRILSTLGILTVAFGAAAFGIKRYTARGASKNQNTRIRVLTQHVLGPRKSLAIVQVAGESILIGITDQNISMLKTIALIDDEFPETMPRNFDTALDEMEEESPRAHARTASADRDDFAVRGLGEIHDKVSTRLRNMKNL